MKTEEFIQKFGKDVWILEFNGADPDFISKIVKKVRGAQPDSKVFCIVSVLTDTTQVGNLYGTWHSNVLLSIDKEHVWVHDPARVVKRSGEHRAIPKEDFFSRWGQAYMRGYIIAG